MEPQRTTTQNKALHKYFELVGNALNEAGLDLRAILKEEVEIPWTPANVKDFLWRPVQKLQLRKESTTELSTKEINLVYETLNRYLGKHGITVEFPNEEWTQ